MHRVTRRTALASLPAVSLPATGLLGTAAAQAAPAAGPGRPAEPDARTGIRLAFLADTHADPENTTSMARLRAVLAAVEAFDPSLVIHGGDVTEHGIEAEYRAFEEAVPDGLRERMVAVPGNHETRWDASAGQLRREHLGESVRVQDLDGLRIILADTTADQQEVAWWTPQALTELEEALRTAGDRPCVLVTHFPMGEGFYYVANQQDMEDVLATRPISLHLTGHTHRELLTRVNRRDQLEAAAVKIDAAYYELTGEIDRLLITRVEISDPTAPEDAVRTEVGTFDLGPEHGRDRFLPRRAEATDEGASVSVDVPLPGSFHGEVDAVLYDAAIYAGRNEELPWSPLQRSGRARFSGGLDASELAEGRQRVHVRVRPEDSSGTRLLTVPFTRGERGTAWEAQLAGMIQGAPAVLDAADGPLLVVGDSSGLVTALDVDGAARWTARVEGDVRRDLVTAHEGRAVAVPDSSGFLHLLAADGSLLWRYATGAPLAADPGAGTIDGAEVLMVCSGTTLHVVDAVSGERRWTAQLPATSMGAPATDGERVLLGVGDGRAHALDARTGAPLWTRSLTDRAGSYQRFIYGPWNDAVTVLPDGSVLASGIADARCLAPEDGAVRWILPGSFQYARETITADGDLLLANESGELVRVDPATGEERARHATAERILDEGFVLVGDVVHTASHAGLISAVDLGSGAVEQITRLSTAPVLAPGAAFGDLVVFGDLAGTVHALAQL
ncbi:outer membrane protein assembly factor BamB family protein [Brachybacterium hainanense]|uniref:PQQ-binding-like beta-propeller repeat protein n=1 Tax=Brachybacterium hainanense TaxID=1541174 RepID=A0ABV6R9B2_9MICO